MLLLSPKVWTLWVAWVCCAPGFGQNQAEQEPEKHWSQFMKGNVTDIQQADEAFRNQNDTRMESRSCGEKPFNRWAWWMSERGGWTSAPKASSWWAAAEAWRTVRSQTSNASMSSTASASQPWQYVGPEGVPTHGGAGRINRLKVDPLDANHWYACAPSGGLWQTHDSGANWEVVGVDILSPLGATDLWIDPEDAQHLWLATGDGNGGDTYSIGLLESWDHGESWVPLELSFESNMERKIQCIAPHRTIAGSFLVATDLGVFQTSNGGESFDLVLPGLARDLVWLNDSVAVAAIDNNGIHRSSDSGVTWDAVVLPESASIGRIQVAAETWGEGNARDTLYAVAGHYFQQSFLGFWQSTDAGLTWTAVATSDSGPNLLGYTITGADNGGQAFWDLCIEVDPADAERVLVGGVNLWETLDGGLTWTCPVHWNGALDAKYAHADQHDIVFLDNGDVLLANDGGVFEWSQNNVVDKSAGLNIAQGYAIASHPSVTDQWMVGTQDNGTNLFSPDQGARILDGDGFNCFFDSENPDRLYASAYYGLLYRSDDGGRTMNNIATYFASDGPDEVGAWQTPFQMHPAVPGRIVSAKKALHFSDDGGETWSSWGGMGTVRSTALALSPLDADVALVAKNNVVHWRDPSTLSFSTISGLPGLQIGDVAIDAEDPASWWVTFSEYEDNAQVWRTTDAGDSWVNVSAGLPVLPVHRIVELPNQQWACASDLGVHLWSEAEQSWQDMGIGLPLAPVVDLEVDTLLHRLLASTYGRGVWSCPLPEVPEQGASITKLFAPNTQCMFTLSGEPEIQVTGSEPLHTVTYVVALVQGETVLGDTIVTQFGAPLLQTERYVLNGFDLEVPSAGRWEVTLQTWSPEWGVLGPPLQTTLFASGLGHNMTLKWWGDCESVDIRWDLKGANASQTLLESAPIAAGDTVYQSWCLSEGCFELVWMDKGGDGISGADCGEQGGFALFNPFNQAIEQAEGLDFGDELVVPFCISVPWCFADFNGDGVRSVTDLLNLLSDFGCAGDCGTDTDFDESVGVSDLMNVLSVYGADCINPN